MCQVEYRAHNKMRAKNYDQSFAAFLDEIQICEMCLPQNSVMKIRIVFVQQASVYFFCLIFNLNLNLKCSTDCL